MMQSCSLISCGRSPSLVLFGSPAIPGRTFRKYPVLRQYISRLRSSQGIIKSQASNFDIGAESYDGAGQTDKDTSPMRGSNSEISSHSDKPLSGPRYLLSVAAVLLGCTLAFSLIVSLKGGPSAIIAALAKSGFTAAFTLIFISEIGDKTFFIAALLAMQYDKALVLIGSTGALSLMTILSVIIGRIFQSVPSQFQTTLPIGEYAAAALLTFFGLNSIKNAWELPSVGSKNSKESPELGELVEAEELVKEKVAKQLTSPIEIVWKSFSLVFFAVSKPRLMTTILNANYIQEWGDRSMLATIALGAAQSPWGVAGGAITGHVFATFIAIIGGALLANYISEKLVGYLGGVMFLIFGVATLLGVF